MTSLSKEHLLDFVQGTNTWLTRNHLQGRRHQHSIRKFVDLYETATQEPYSCYIDCRDDEFRKISTTSMGKKSRQGDKFSWYNMPTTTARRTAGEVEVVPGKDIKVVKELGKFLEN